MADSRMVETRFYGFFGPDFVCDGPVTATIEELQQGLPPPDTLGTTRIYDARRLQSLAAHDAARFFDEHGFVLLPHESSVQNWDLDPPSPTENHELVTQYPPEAEALIRSQLLPGRKLEV